MERYIVSIGSNAANRSLMVEEAFGWLSSLVKVTAASSPYTLPDSSGRTELCYTNIVAVAQTDITLPELSAAFDAYETSRGRRSGDSVVTIDLDIVWHNGEVLRPGDFASPHFRFGLSQLPEDVRACL